MSFKIVLFSLALELINEFAQAREFEQQMLGLLDILFTDNLMEEYGRDILFGNATREIVF